MSDHPLDSASNQKTEPSLEELQLRVAVLEEQLASCQRELAAWQERFEAVLHTVSHDIRGPLTLISGYTQAALSRHSSGRGSERDRSDLQATSHAAYRLDKMISQVVDANRLENNRLSYRFDQTDLTVVLRQQVRHAGKRYPGRKLNLEIERRLPVVHSDSRRVGQIVATLLSNAVRFSPESEPVDVSATVDDAQIRIEVRDRGAGITRQEQSHLFEPYYRSERLRDIKREGLGLSLFIANGLANLLQAQVCTHSPGEDQGATFALLLPINAPPETAAVDLDSFDFPEIS